VRERIDTLLSLDPEIDTIILGCTHYPLLLDKISRYCPQGITLIPQGKYIAESLEDYLDRHVDMEQSITRGGACRYFTTESASEFRNSASLFLRENIEAERIVL
jgi:glutamate racemase